MTNLLDAGDARSRLRTARELARAEARWLRRGFYLRSGPTLWRRFGSSISSHVRQTKAHPSQDGLRSVLRSALDLRYAFWSARHGTAEAVIVAYDGGTVVLDEKNHRVVRTYGEGDVNSDYVRWRKAFTRHVAAPRFEVADGGARVIEELVEGRHLLELDDDHRMDAIRRLVRDYATLTRHERDSTRSDFGESVTRTLHAPSCPPTLTRRWRGISGSGLPPRAVVCVPSAYEASAKNLMVTTDGIPVPIDLGDLRPEPFFAYPLGIVVAGGESIVKAFLDGGLDAEFALLFDAAGAPWDSSRGGREGWLLVRLAYAAARDGATLPGNEDVIRAESLHRRWADLEPMLEGVPSP